MMSLHRVSAALSLHGPIAFASTAPVADDPKDNAPTAAPSCREISPVWNAVAFRRSFPAAWAHYLRDTYRTAYAVQKAFQIDSHTARDWLGGKRDPHGSFVVAEVVRNKNAIKILGGME